MQLRAQVLLVFPAKLGACDTKDQALGKDAANTLEVRGMQLFDTESENGASDDDDKNEGDYTQDDVDTVDLMFEITKICDGTNDVLEWLDTNAPVDYVDRFITLGELFSVE